MRVSTRARRRGAWLTRRHRRGQALVEFALIAPFLVILLAGGSQVGAIAYTQISTDTAAREGARAGVQAPNKSLAWAGATPGTRTCTASDYTSNPICVAVLNADGFLTPSTFTSAAPSSGSSPCASGQACTTIQVTSTLSRYSTSPKVRLAASGSSGCNTGSQATVTGVVSGMGSGVSGTIIDLTGETTTTDTSGNYTMCVAANNETTSQTLTARSGSGCNDAAGSVGPFSVSAGSSYTKNFTVTQGHAVVTGTVDLSSVTTPGQTATVSDSTGDSVSNITGFYSLCVAANQDRTLQTVTAQVGSAGCGGWSGSIGPFDVFSGNTYSGKNFAVTAEPTCTTTTSSSTTSTSTTSSVTSSCQASPDWEQDYITVTVTYPAPIFVPFIGGLLQTQSGVHMVTSSVTFGVYPCTMTKGA